MKAKDGGKKSENISDAVIKSTSQKVAVKKARSTPVKRASSKSPPAAAEDLPTLSPSVPVKKRTKRPTEAQGSIPLPLDPIDELNVGQLDEHLPPKFFITRKDRSNRFRKSNSLVHHHPQQVMTPVQQKLTNILLRHAQNNDPIGELTWEISAAEILKVLTTGSRNYEHIEKVILQMMNIKVKWDVFEKRGIAKNYSVVFPHTKYLAGTITYQIQKDAAALLSSLDSYTPLDIDEEMGLSKSCSIPIYENASRYLGIGHSRWFEWEQLRDLVLSSSNIPKNAQSWGTFNERYLGPAVRDVNAKTRLLVQIETQKEGKHVKYARILVQQPKSQLGNSALSASSATKGVLIDSMRLIGLTDTAITKVLRLYSEDDIKGGIAHVKWRQSAKHLKSIFRLDKYFTDSLKNGWHKDAPSSDGIGLSGDLFPDVASPNLTPDEPAEPVTVRKTKAAAPKKSEAEVGMEKMIQAVKVQRLLDVKLILGELTDSQIEDEHKLYNATILTQSMHIKKGRNKAGVLASFHHWYAVKIFGDSVSTEDIVKFMASKIGSSSTPL